MFIAEGNKLAAEILRSDFTIRALIATDKWYSKVTGTEDSHKWQTFELFGNAEEIIVESHDIIKRISLLSAPQEVLLVVSIPSYKYKTEDMKSELALAFDDIRDPGNMGTILRICDWFGIQNIFCSPESVDIYNPKSVQASMGSITRTKVHYIGLEQFLKEVNDAGDIPVYGTLLKGNNIYNENLSPNGLVLFGNESSGISSVLMPFISKKIYVPDFSMHNNKPESLNISAAAAIVCSEFRRKAND